MKSCVRAFLNLRVPMRDQTELATHVYLPDGPGPFPVLLLRTPYEAIGKGAGVLEWPGRGYAYVTQDTRGCFLSEGEFFPWINEREDGEDTLDWIAEQPWCNGNIAMYGGSYPGMTQLAAAASGHPALKCITPCLIGQTPYHASYWGGAFRLYWQTGWGLKPPAHISREQMNLHLPLLETDLMARGHEIPYWRAALEHPHQDAFWRKTYGSSPSASTGAPAFLRTGWFDLFICDTFELFNDLKLRGRTPYSREHTRLLVGPWPHNINQRQVGEVDFGEVAVVSDLYQQELDYIDQHTITAPGPQDTLAPSQPGPPAPLRLFIMGENVWRDEWEWPLARTRWTDFYLGGSGRANTAAGDGTLAPEPAATAAADHYVYDPEHPVPTHGGAWDFENIGSRDQTEIEKRADVLVYTSTPLEDDLEATGPVEVELYISSSAPDTDFTAKLVDVHPDGRAMSVTDGIVRARYREEDGAEDLLVPDQIYRLRLRCNPTAHVFSAGHRLRLEISSSNFPAFSRNPNTGTPIATETRLRAAEQTVWHSGVHPSRLILPVIPR